MYPMSFAAHLPAIGNANTSSGQDGHALKGMHWFRSEDKHTQQPLLTQHVKAGYCK